MFMGGIVYCYLPLKNKINKINTKIFVKFEDRKWRMKK